jgi:HEAT repeat protein
LQNEWLGALVAALVICGVPVLFLLAKKYHWFSSQSGQPADLAPVIAAAQVPFSKKDLKKLMVLGHHGVRDLLRTSSIKWPAPVLAELRAFAVRSGYVDEWLTQLNSPQATERMAAAEVLTILKIDQAVPFFVNMLTDQVEDVRWVVAAGLKEMGDQSIVRPLLYLLTEPNRCTPARVASILVDLGSTAIPTLLEALATLPAETRLMVIEILGQMQTPQVVPGLTALLSDANPVVRAKAAVALGENGDLGAFEPLVYVLKDPDELVRARAASALGQLGSPQAIGVLNLAQQDPSWWVQTNAAAALAVLDPDADQENSQPAATKTS